MNKRLLFLVNDAGFFLSHRSPIALAARAEGFDVAVVCPNSPDAAKLAEKDLRHIALDMRRGRISLLEEIGTIRRLDRIFRDERPDLVHLITSKPIIYGGLVARRHGVPVVAAISGLGHIFIDAGLKTRLLRCAALLGYRLAMRRRGVFPIFQNRDNLELFRRAGAIREEPTLLPGSGTDLSRFDPSPVDTGTFRVGVPCRMLRSKGILEVVAAARELKRTAVEAEFVLIGNPDPANPASVARADLQAWHDEGIVRWLGYRADVENVLKTCDVVALPSYSEGFPKALVDAAAAGRAMVTTDVPGCREAVEHGVTGLIVAPRDPIDLAAKLKVLANDRSLRLRLGREAREMAERRYAIEGIVHRHLELYRRALASEVTAW